MAKLSTAERLEVAIRNYADEGMDSETSVEIATRMYGDESQVIEPFLKDWAIEKLASLIAKHRAKKRREKNVQLQLEMNLGFRGLPRTMENRYGSRASRGDAQVGHFIHMRAQLRKEAGKAKIETMDRAVELFRKYTPTEPKITWDEVLKRESESGAQ